MTAETFRQSLMSDLYKHLIKHDYRKQHIIMLPDKGNPFCHQAEMEPDEVSPVSYPSLFL